MSPVHLPIRALLVVGLMLSARGAFAQQSADLSVEEMTRKAGVIFLGVVTKLEAPTPEHPVAAVTFKVVEGVRGVQSGEEFTLREWGGLWPSGSSRYRTGQTLVMFLHSPELGLSSPVGGTGRFEVTAGDAVRFTSRQRDALLRSPRLAPMLFPNDTARQPLHVAEMVRALRLLAQPGSN